MNDCCESINEAHERLKSELEELRQRTTWRPADTAPIGRRVLTRDRIGLVTIGERLDIWYDDEGCSREEEPVEWMELPT